MSAIPVLLAGTVGMGHQDHQASTWAPNLAKAGLAPVAVWTPPAVGDAALERARGLAAACGVFLEVSPSPTTPAAGAIVCLRGADRVTFAAHAARRGLPVLLDKPTLDTTAQLTEFAAAAGDLPVLPGHHYLSHPGFSRVLRAVRDAEIGLLRAVHTDLVSGGGEPSDVGELRNLGVHLIELMRRVTGPASVTLQAHASAGGAAWSFLGKTDRAVVVSHHSSRACADSREPVRQLRAGMRVIGTHGFLTVDLTRPALEVRSTRGSKALPFAEPSVVAHLRTFASLAGRSACGVPPGPAASTATAADFVTLSRALDGMAASAASGQAHEITW